MRILGLSATLFLMLWGLPGMSQEASKCVVADPELQGKYTGGCVVGLAEGQGEATGSASYKGGFRAGRKHGKGVKTWPSGDRYEGDFVDDRKEGRGTYTWGPRSPWPGEKYSGEYVNDWRHGHGVYEWPGSDRYAGPWKDDVPVGALTPRMMARARADAERAAAVSKPGVRVCREMVVGVSTRDWVRGTVTATEAGRIAVRIDNPGQFQHVIANQIARKGDVVRDAPQAWIPCL
jgi:hypothetical protein